jgi:hypothetical protein
MQTGPYPILSPETISPFFSSSVSSSRSVSLICLSNSVTCFLNGLKFDKYDDFLDLFSGVSLSDDVSVVLKNDEKDLDFFIPCVPGVCVSFPGVSFPGVSFPGVSFPGVSFPGVCFQDV